VLTLAARLEAGKRKAARSRSNSLLELSRQALRWAMRLALRSARRSRLTRLAARIPGGDGFCSVVIVRNRRHRMYEPKARVPTSLRRGNKSAKVYLVIKKFAPTRCAFKDNRGGVTGVRAPKSSLLTFNQRRNLTC
jgi:hypothetical protein